MCRKRNQSMLIFILLGGALFFSGCDEIIPQETLTPEPVQSQPVTPIVSATGVIIPAEFTTLSMSIAGLVEEVLVEEGDQVEEGQVLIRIKGREELRAAIAAAKFEFSAAEKAFDDLTKAADSTATQSQEAISVYTKQVRDAQYQLDNFTVPIDQADLEPMEAVEVTRELLDQAREAFEPYRYRSSNDSTRKDRKEALDEAQSDHNSAVKRLSYITELEVAQTNLEEAIKDYETYKGGPDPIEVKVAEARLNNAKAALSTAEASFNDLELAAHYAGTITEVNIRKGEWVVPGQPILQLADLVHLRVETTDLNEIDAAQVDPGSEVTVTFDALVDEVIKGSVLSIAPKASSGSGVNYTVIIELEELPEALRWGMTAFVDIEVKS